MIFKKLLQNPFQQGVFQLCTININHFIPFIRSPFKSLRISLKISNLRTKPEIRLQNPNGLMDCQTLKGTFVVHLKTNKKFFEHIALSLKGTDCQRTENWSNFAENGPFSPQFFNFAAEYLRLPARYRQIQGDFSIIKQNNENYKLRYMYTNVN